MRNPFIKKTNIQDKSKQKQQQNKKITKQVTKIATLTIHKNQRPIGPRCVKTYFRCWQPTKAQTSMRLRAV